MIKLNYLRLLKNKIFLMNNINIIWKILNLNLKKYKILICNIEKDNILEFHIKWINKYCTCP